MDNDTVIRLRRVVLKLARQLKAGQTRVWSLQRSGFYVRSMAFPLDGEKLERLIAFITRGLLMVIQAT